MSVKAMKTPFWSIGVGQSPAFQRRGHAAAILMTRVAKSRVQ
jgi:hypothetical protein